MDAVFGGWLRGLVAFFGVGLGVATLALLWESWREWRRRRAVAQQIRQLSDGSLSPGGEVPRQILREAQRPEPAWLEPIVARLPQRRDLQHLLDQADVRWSVGSLLIATVGLAAGLGSLVVIAGGGRVLALVLAAVGGSLPLAYLKRRRSKRVSKFEKDFPEAIDLLGRSIRAGHALSSGLEIVSEELADPVATEFRQIFEEQKFGLPLRDSLLSLADRVPLVEVRIFVTAVLIQRESGGNLAEILDNIAYTIRERFKIRRQLRVYTAQGRMTGYLLAVLPIAMGVAIFAASPEYMSVLFEEPGGRLALALAAFLQVLGYFTIRRIIDIEI